MGLGPQDILARHKVDSGLLKGKIVSDVPIWVESSKVVNLVKGFTLPDTNRHFKKWCESELELGFDKKQRLPQAVFSFIESCYRGLSEYGAMIVELTYLSGDEIYLAVNAQGHWDANRFGGREAQMNYDATHEASVEKAYRLRRYDVVATLFPDEKAANFHFENYHKRYGKDNAGLLQKEEADSILLSQRIPEKWFSGKLNHFVPEEFAEQLDEDAIKLIFGLPFWQRMLGKKPGKPKLSAEVRAKIVEEVKAYYGNMMFWNDDDDLLKLHADVPQHTNAQFERQYSLSVKMKCDLTVSVRKPR